MPDWHLGDGRGRRLQWSALVLMLAIAPGRAALAVVPVNGSADPADVIRPVPDTGLGLHTSVYANQFTNSSLDDRLIESGADLLRYPGGSYSDLFHWSVPPTLPYYTCCNSGLPDVTLPHPITPGRGADPGVDPPGNEYPFAYHASGSHFGNFINLLDATGTKAMITVNYGSSLGNFDAGSGKWLSTKGGQPQEAAAWVAYANVSPDIYGTEDDVDLGVDEEGVDWKTAGYWARLRASTQAEYDTWSQADGVHDPANRFLAVNRDQPVGINHWEIGNEINGNGYYATFWDWEQDLHGAYDGNRVNDPALSPTSYANNLIQFSALMKQVDPTIQVGAVLVGPGGAGDDGNPSRNWDRNVLLTAGDAQVEVNGQNYNAIDFGILHWYVNNEPTFNGQGDFNNQCDGSLADCEANLLNSVSTTSAAANSLPFTFQELRNRIDTYTDRDPNAFPIHMTEFGYFDSIGGNNPVTGLFAADVYATALSEGAETAHFLEMSSLFLSDSGSLTRFPAFRAFELLDRFFDPGDEFIDTTSDSPNLKIHAVRKPDGSVAIMLINIASGDANDAEVTLDIPGSQLSEDGTRWLWGTDNMGSGGALLEANVADLGNNFTITVPDRTALVLLIPEAPAVLAGDYNNDGVVDAGDYVRWRNALAGIGTIENETVSEGVVDEMDYAEWKANYGSPGGGGGSLAVPEPSSLLLMTLAAAAFAYPRRRPR